jgi:glycosyltransferase involved in cell wall biosynthesis
MSVSAPRGDPRILYTTADASPQSGAFRSLLEMSSEIQRWGYESLVVLRDEARIEPMVSAIPNRSRLSFLPLPLLQRGRTVTQYASDAAKTATSIARLVGTIRRERVALVHANEILDVYAAIAARLAGIPCIWHIRADFSLLPSVYASLFPRIAVGLATEIIVVSSSTYESVFVRRGIESGKVSVIHDPGPDPTVFHPGVDGSAVRKELAPDEDAGLVVLIAKLEEPKGHEVLIRAVPLVLAEHPKTRFVIVGGELDGVHHRRYAERVRRLPGEIGVDHAVTFTGYRPDVAQIMAAADVVTHCSTYPDPFPGVVLQGMALGKAVVASNVGGPREQIEDGLSGVLVRPGDPSALAREICSLLRQPERRASVGARAASRVNSAFSSQSFYQRLSRVYARHLSPRTVVGSELVAAHGEGGRPRA